jgi:dihydrodipicolinate synthase/N-acetylneuraminate lyase
MEKQKTAAMEKLKGLIVPVLTPFDGAGKIDQHAFVQHLEFLDTTTKTS